MRTTPTPRAVSLLLAIACAACGSKPTGTGDAGVDNPELAKRYNPLSVGATFRYKVTDVDTQQVASKGTTVEAEEDVGGKTALRVRTETTDGFTVSWQAYEGPIALRYREEELTLDNVKTVSRTFDPYKLRFDESEAHLVEGATFTETYTENTTTVSTGQTKSSAKSATWTVESLADSITVPAGTFSTVRIRRRTGSGSDKLYWFARGVGKVKESGGQLEELEQFNIPGLPQ